MNHKRGLNRFSKLPDDGDTWAPNNKLKLKTKEKHLVEPRWAKRQTRSSGPSNLNK